MSAVTASRPRVSLIAAMGRNRAIGLDNRLPWRLPADLKRFKALTVGHPLVIGRRTFESIGKPLAWRTTIVVSRQPGYAPEGALAAPSLDAALALARETAPGDPEIFVGGGEGIFREALADQGERIYLTVIDHDFPGDTFFPEFDESRWRLTSREDYEATEAAPWAFSFQTWDR